VKTLRKILFWAHLITGVFVGIIVLIMSVTGVLLTYQRQMTAWADTRALNAAPPDATAQSMPADSLLLRVRTARPGTPTAITWRNTADAPVAIAFGREGTVFANAYTGAVLGEGSTSVRRFFRVTTDIHRWLAGTGEYRAVGRAITGAANLGFLFLVTSGLYLWWPRRWSRAAVRNVAMFRGGLSGKPRNFNWHNVVGLWLVLPLFLIVASGVVISYPWASALVYRMVGESPPAPATPAAPARPAPSSPPATWTSPVSRESAWASETSPSPDTTRLPAHPATKSLDALASTARSREPGWRILTMQLPRSETAPVVFTLDTGTGGQPQAKSQLTLDRVTGSEIKFEPFSAGSTGRRLRSILRFTHTGEVLGLTGQTIAGIVSAGAILLVWTGLALTLHRMRAWRARTRRAVPATD
jgi:uncharacterized iron-regulated membrane protein